MHEQYYVYALINENDRIYVGMTLNSSKRLIEHNSGNVFSTKYYRPWKIFYCEKVGSRELARKEEKRLKSGYGKEFLKSIVHSGIAQR